jgi:hypothetical protein
MPQRGIAAAAKIYFLKALRNIHAIFHGIYPEEAHGYCVTHFRTHA